MLQLGLTVLFGLEGPKVVGSTNLFLFDQAIINQGLVNVGNGIGTDSGLGDECRDFFFRVDLLGFVVDAVVGREKGVVVES